MNGIGGGGFRQDGGKTARKRRGGRLGGRQQVLGFAWGNCGAAHFQRAHIDDFGMFKLQAVKTSLGKHLAADKAAVNQPLGCDQRSLGVTQRFSAPVAQENRLLRCHLHIDMRPTIAKHTLGDVNDLKLLRQDAADACDLAHARAGDDRGPEGQVFDRDFAVQGQDMGSGQKPIVDWLGCDRSGLFASKL